MAKKIIKLIFSGLIPLFLITSCGNDSSAPPNASIVVNPNGITWAVGLGGGCPAAYPGANPHLSIHRISVNTAGGKPLGNVDVDLSLDLSSGSFGFPVAWLLLDLNGDGFWDGYDAALGTALGSEELISSNLVGSPYRAQTNEFGWLDVGILLDLGSCSFSGGLSIQSGVAPGRLDFSVTAS